MKKTTSMNTTEFRKELVKIMPGFSWTVQRPDKMIMGYLCAIGIKTSGFNRLCTLKVQRRENDGEVRYEVWFSGYGKNSPWLGSMKDTTLAQALRGLQNSLEHRAQLFSGAASYMRDGRKPNPKETEA